MLHDATEALMGGWDPITPLKPHLGPGFSTLIARLQAAVLLAVQNMPYDRRKLPCRSDGGDLASPA